MTQDFLAAPIFFISLTSICQFNGARLDPGSAFEAQGSLCAYAEEADIVYSCPASDPFCWNTGGQCSGGDDLTAGPNEVACSDIGSESIYWCCNNQYGNCTQTEFQQNNCWSRFDNPNRSINSLAASSSASVAKQIAVSQPTLTNIIVSSVAAGGWVAETITSLSSTLESTPNPTSDQLSSPTTSSSANAAQSSNSGSRPISNGAVAGIAVGAALLGIIVTIAGFAIRRKRRRNHQRTTLESATAVIPLAPDPQEKSTTPDISQSSGTMYNYSNNQLVELPAGNEPGSRSYGM